MMSTKLKVSIVALISIIVISILIRSSEVNANIKWDAGEDGCTYQVHFQHRNEPEKVIDVGTNTQCVLKVKRGMEYEAYVVALKDNYESGIKSTTIKFIAPSR
jgi:hypothetical protein